MSKEKREELVIEVNISRFREVKTIKILQFLTCWFPKKKSSFLSVLGRFESCNYFDYLLIEYFNRKNTTKRWKRFVFLQTRHNTHDVWWGGMRKSEFVKKMKWNAKQVETENEEKEWKIAKDFKSNKKTKTKKFYDKFFYLLATHRSSFASYFNYTHHNSNEIIHMLMIFPSLAHFSINKS